MKEQQIERLKLWHKQKYDQYKQVNCKGKKLIENQIYGAISALNFLCLGYVKISLDLKMLYFKKELISEVRNDT